MALLPTEHPPGFGGITHEQINFRGTIELFVCLHILPVVESNLVESPFAELTHGVCFASGYDVVVGLVGLQHAPHALDVLRGVAPVADGVEVAEGVVVLTAGTFGNVLRFLPPLVIGDDLLNEGLDVVEQAFVASV